MSEWLNELSEDMRENEVLKRFDSVEALAKSAIEASTYRGQSIKVDGEDYTKVLKHYPDLIRKPNPDKSFMDQGEEFHAIFGVPEDTYENPENFSGLNDEALAVVQKMAKEAKLNREQYGVIVEAIAGNMSAANTANKEGYEGEMTSLDNDWGLARDDRRSWVNNEVQAWNDENPDDQIGSLTAAEYKYFWSLHNRLGGGKPNGGDVGKKTVLNSKAEAQTKLSDLKRTDDWKEMMAGRLPREAKDNLIKRSIELRKQVA